MNRKQVVEKAGRYLPIIITAIVFALYHCFMSVENFDDAWFRENYAKASLITILTERYQTWTSRILIELIMYLAIKYPLLWKIVDTIFIVCIQTMLCKILDTKGKETWLCCFFILICPFRDMSGAGWIATTMNYIWPLCGALYVCLKIKKCKAKEALKWYEYLISTIALLYAANQEQVAAVMFVVLGFQIFLQIKKGNLHNFYLYFMSFITILSLINIMTCPGNNLRYIREVEVYTPSHPNLSIIRKLCAGLLNIFRGFIGLPNQLFTTIVIILIILVYLKYRSVKKTIVSALPLLLIFAHTILGLYLPELAMVFISPPNSFDFSLKAHIVNLIELAVIIFALLYTVYQLLAEQLLESFIYVALLLGASFAATLIIGLSASLYVSGNRIFMCLYFSLIYSCIFCICKNRRKIIISKNVTAIISFAAGILALANIGSNIYLCILL